MDDSSIKCVGGILYCLSHPSNIDEFIYTNPNNEQNTRYTKKIIHGQVFYVAEGIEQKFVNFMPLQNYF